MDGGEGKITVKNDNLIVSRRKKMPENFSTKDKTLETVRRRIHFYSSLELGFTRPHILVLFIV